MDLEDVVMGTQEPKEETKPEEATTQPTDSELKIEALQELLKENNELVKSLQSELLAVKKDNAKMLARLDVSKEVDIGDTMDSLFNKYSKKGL